MSGLSTTADSTVQVERDQVDAGVSTPAGSTDREDLDECQE